MNLVASLIKLMFGTKSEKDRKLIAPYVEKILAIYPSIEQLSNDELRARSAALKAAVADHIREDEQQIADLKAQLENLDTSLEDKERISKQIDSLTETIDKKIEEKLEEILPEAFAIVKDTARRFKENSEIVVTATDFDRELAASKRISSASTAIGAVYSNTLDGRRQQDHMGHGALRLPACSAASSCTRATSPRWRPARARPSSRRFPVFLNALAGQGRPRRDGQRLPRPARLGMDGAPRIEFHGLSVDCIDRHQPNSAGPAQGLHGRHHLRHEQRIRFRLPARQYVELAGGPRAAQASLRDRRRGRLGADRRRPDSADHFRSRPQRRRPDVRAVPGSRRESVQLAAQSGDPTGRRREEADRRRQERAGRHPALPRA